MTHLNIQQGLNIEVVSTNLIKKLYEAALSVPEPLEGELDAAYMSGNLLVDKSYRAYVEYLTNRFDDLHINVTDSYYIPFEDSAVLNVLLANNIGSDGIGVTEAEAANANLVGVFNSNTDITKFNEFRYFTSAKTNIPSLLFYLCSNLKEVYLEDTINIGSAAFRECGIEDVTAPSLLSIDVNCFNLSGVKTITNLGSIITIPDYAFYRCKSLLSAVLPSTVTSIGTGAFDCSYTQVILNFTTISGLDNVTSFGNSCFNSRSSLVIQGSSILNALTIGSNAFKGTAITGTISLPHLTSLGDNAFLSCTGITSVDLTGSTVTSIPQNCFSGCTNLSSVGNLSNVLSIGERAFYGCSSLTGTLNLPSLISLGNAAFQLTNITSVLNLGLVSEIVDPFYNCRSITEIVLPTTLRKSSSFYNTHVSKLIYPYGFTEKIAGLMCGDELGRYLLYILFPSTVTKIMCNDMYRDAGKSRIRCHIVVLATTPPNMNRNPSDTGGMGLGWGWGDPSLANWYVPDAVVNTYKADAQWSSIANYIFPISQLKKDSPTCWAWYQANKDYGVPTQP